jgi:hypothetical protein
VLGDHGGVRIDRTRSSGLACGRRCGPLRTSETPRQLPLQAPARAPSPRIFGLMSGAWARVEALRGDLQASE